MQSVDTGGTNGGRATKRRKIEEDGAESDPNQEIFSQENQVQPQLQDAYKPYGNTSVGGNGTLWQGDLHGTQINHYYTGDGSSKDKGGVLLDSLTFDRMDARVRNVLTALPNTCHWLQEHEKFRAWIDADQMQEHCGFLWIKGKPGSGKSTVMKETLIWAEKNWASQLILTYFFNARSPNILEKSSLGLYRSLVYQLILACPEHQALFTSRFGSKLRPREHMEEWTAPELQNFLVELVTTHEQQPITILIDALDEGDTDDVRPMISFLEHLTKHSILANRITRVCLSSCHFPHITIRKGLSLTLEDQPEHRRDISFYISSQLTYDGPNANELQRQVLDRSAGVFLWVVLVIVMLNELEDRGKGLSTMFQKLGETQDLHHIFSNVLARGSEDIEECITLLRWVLFSLRPLSPIELYIAVQMCGSEDIQNNAIPTPKRITNYLLTCSRGLVEITTANPPVVQFIHETVRDFLLYKIVPYDQRSDEIQSQFTLPVFRHDYCHLKLAEECVQYLISVSQIRPLANVEQGSLAKYAAEYWWQHAWASGSKYSAELLALFENFLTDCNSLCTWVQLCGIGGLYYLCEPRQVNDTKTIFSGTKLSATLSNLAPPLYYAVQTGIIELVTLLLDHGSDVNAQGGRLGNALQTASYAGFTQTVQLLLDHGADVNAQGGEFGSALQAASSEDHERVVNSLIEKGADVNAQGGRFDNALCAAVVRGQMSVVQILLKHGANPSIIGKNHGPPLHSAARDDNEPILRLLLDYGANTSARNACGQTALILAVVEKQKAASRLLVQAQTDLSIIDNYGRTAVDWLKVLRTDDELLEIIKGGSSPPSTTTIQRRHKLCLSITSISTSLLEDELQKFNAGFYEFDELGRFFTMLNDIDNAMFSFQQCIDTLSDARGVHHGIECDSCCSQPIKGARYVCTTCCNTDLCAPCMDAYNIGIGVQHCRNHGFMKVAPSSGVLASENEKRMWLQSVIEKYTETKSYDHIG